jgi:hypothetical protein
VLIALAGGKHVVKQPVQSRFLRLRKFLGQGDGLGSPR